MNKIKSHFQFSNQQRNGIFLLLAIIVTLQCIYAFVNFSSDSSLEDSNEIDAFRNQLDSLRFIEIEN
ncbi:MAG: helix-hairpin-helix domain-containing protein, partial [Winogradskyella sp.]|nr:helix-hairpin-helix domain-containing protein [Winogradskyella sp.]